jgi:hypothetical protein
LSTVESLPSPHGEERFDIARVSVPAGTRASIRS